jgi:NADH:ubiquinone oxidoreductase subunit 4 (subunit M)
MAKQGTRVGTYAFIIVRVNLTYYAHHYLRCIAGSYIHISVFYCVYTDCRQPHIRTYVYVSVLCINFLFLLFSLYGTGWQHSSPSGCPERSRGGVQDTNVCSGLRWFVC